MAPGPQHEHQVQQGQKTGFDLYVNSNRSAGRGCLELESDKDSESDSEVEGRECSDELAMSAMGTDIPNLRVTQILPMSSSLHLVIN